ncbi:hypothetical protein [Sulfurimonas sp.]|uniref:hypothetical protein n=1 Tax=Sulfurimonas sp. TaxID=2022749 RepID=UPI0035651D50
MKTEKMIEKYIKDNVLDLNQKYGTKAKRAEAAIINIIENSTIESVTKILDLISYQEIQSGDETDLNEILYIKIGGGEYSAYINYICVPREILKKSVQKRLFPRRLVSIDAKKLIIK